MKGNPITGALTEQQLTILMHLCNGLTLGETATTMNYSEGSIGRTLATARKSMGAKTTYHLIGIAMARDLLVYVPDENDKLNDKMVIAPPKECGPAERHAA